MNAVSALYQSTIGKKIAMAVTGAIMVGYVVVHMLGNLLIFAGPEVLNDYGEKIQGSGPLVWGIRFILLASVIIHVWSAISLSLRNRAARGSVGYQGGRKNLATNLAALTMKYGGLLLLLYIPFHILDQTVGVVHPQYIRGDVYSNLIIGFSNPLVALFYIVAMAALGLHLYHGVWSMMQTVGFNHPRYNVGRQRFAAILAVVVSVGFALVPLAIVTGLVGPV